MAHHSTTPRFSLVFYSQFRRLWKFNSSRTVYIFFEHQFIVCFSQSSDSELFWGIESIALEQGCSCYRHSNINQQPRRILSFIDNDSGILIVNVTCTQSTCQLIVSYCLPETALLLRQGICMIVSRSKVADRLCLDTGQLKILVLIYIFSPVKSNLKWYLQFRRHLQWEDPRPALLPPFKRQAGLSSTNPCISCTNTKTWHQKNG